MDVDAYLARIGLAAAPPVDLDGLETLQRSHLTHVPFENLDVFHRRGVSTDPQRSIPKIVGGRGGWCFELNGAFASLLESLGFAVTRLGATVLAGGAPSAGPHPDHAAIRVDLDHPYLVDVGFGDSFIRPLRLDGDGSLDGGEATYDFIRRDGNVVLRRLDAQGPAPQYEFSLDPVAWTRFDPSNTYLQTSPDTNFTTKPFATRLLEGGPDRVTLVHDRLRTRIDGVWSETPVSGSDWPAVLSEWFGMDP